MSVRALAIVGVLGAALAGGAASCDPPAGVRCASDADCRGAPIDTRCNADGVCAASCDADNDCAVIAAAEGEQCANEVVGGVVRSRCEVGEVCVSVPTVLADANRSTETPPDFCVVRAGDSTTGDDRCPGGLPDRPFHVVQAFVRLPDIPDGGVVDICAPDATFECADGACR